jgi:alpha-ketoglutarate-dependent 2,4-dichlorophenoxyacetate dioxygenase
MDFAFRQIGPTFCAEVSGLDLRRDLEAETVRKIQAAIDVHAVLVFRDQAMDDAAQVAFSRHFGPLEIAPDTTRVVGAHPEILELVDIGDTTKFQSLAQLWHTDGSYRPVPSYITTLRALEISPEGGETWFADTRAAWDALPDSRKREIRGLRVVHDYEYSRSLVAGARGKTEAESVLKPSSHPLVCVHPGSGRPSLYLSNHAREIEGKPVSEGQALLRELLEWATQPKFRYEHRWRPNDYILWDNRGTIHRVTPYDASRHRRVMHRTEIGGGATPVAA